MSSMVTLYTTPEPFDSLCIIVWILAFSLPFFHMFYYYYSLQLFLTISLPPPLCLFLFFPLLLSERRRVEQPLYSLHSPPKEVSMSMSVVCTGNVRRTACVNLFALMVRVSQVIEWIEYCLIGLLYSTTKHREPSICTANLMEITHLVFKIGFDGPDDGDKGKVRESPTVFGFILCRPWMSKAEFMAICPTVWHLVPQKLCHLLLTVCTGSILSGP